MSGSRLGHMPPGEGRVADEHEVQIGAGNAVCCESAHGDRLGGGALRVSEDRQRVLGAESAWIRSEFVLHGENDVVCGREATRALLDQFGRRQHLQRRGARVGPDHVADRRGGRATVEAQRVQKQILGGLREGGRRRRLGGSTEDDRRVAPSTAGRPRGRLDCSVRWRRQRTSQLRRPSCIRSPLHPSCSPMRPHCDLVTASS